MKRLLIEQLRPFALHAVGASFVLHLALLIPAFCVLNLFERVLTSGNRRGLMVLGAIALSGMLLAYVAERVRNRALLGVGRTFDRELQIAAMASSLDALRDVGLLRTFVGTQGIVALLDLPWLLLYVGAITLIEPLLGMAALTGVALLTCIMSVAAGLARSVRSDALLRAARIASDHAEELVSSAETLETMGMSDEGQSGSGTYRCHSRPAKAS